MTPTDLSDMPLSIKSKIQCTWHFPIWISGDGALETWIADWKLPFRLRPTTIGNTWMEEQGHQELSGKSEENKSFQPNQLAPSIYIMIALCFSSLDQWQIRIHLLWEKCFKVPHYLNQTKFNDLLPLTIAGVPTQTTLRTEIDKGRTWDTYDVVEYAKYAK